MWELAGGVCQNCLTGKRESKEGKQDVYGSCQGTILGSHRRDALARSLNDVMLNRITSQVRIRFEIQFRQDAGTVGTDGFDAEGELIGNVCNRASGGDQAEHLVLTIGEGNVKWLLTVAVLIHVCREKFSRFGRNVFSSLPDGLDGMN